MGGVEGCGHGVHGCGSGMTVYSICIVIVEMIELLKQCTMLSMCLIKKGIEVETVF